MRATAFHANACWPPANRAACARAAAPDTSAAPTELPVNASGSVTGAGYSVAPHWGADGLGVGAAAGCEAYTCCPGATSGDSASVIALPTIRSRSSTTVTPNAARVGGKMPDRQESCFVQCAG